MGSDLSVVNAARVSFNKESTWETTESFCDDNVTKELITELSVPDARLINYLAKHGHWSPFAHNSLTFRIKAPIFVARQLVKHTVGGVWNEVSRRYVDDEPEFYFPETWRGKPVNAKQGSSEVVLKGDWDNLWIANYDGYNLLDHEGIIELSLRWYNNAIKQGVAPEQARMVLPQNTMTEWWWTGSLMFFARVCKQRLDPHAQEETRHIAQLINDAIPKEFQHSWQALRSS